MKMQRWLWVCLLLGACSSGNKTAYVDLNVLFDKFPMKKQLEAKLQNTHHARKAIMDSIALQLQYRFGHVSNSSSEEEKRQLLEEKKAYLEKKQYFDEDNARQGKDYNDQIWKQINQYVRDYGEANGYDYIYGAEGSGTIMYASKAHDITDKVGEYISKRYGGGKK